MLGDNIRELRKKKGMTQEELAARLHVVRQTVSKWEKGLSVPDAEMLKLMAEELECSTSELLGAVIEKEEDVSEVAEQLSRINEQLAIKNRRSGKVLKVIAIVIAALVFIQVAVTVAGITLYRYDGTAKSEVVTVEEESSVEVEEVEEAQ